jgi:N-acetylglucosaminyl-diphospho-decaprenol L-rhamnosyltransferase
MGGSIHIVIVNWNTAGYLRDCLRSIAASDRDGVNLVRVTVVDNASTDRSSADLDDLGVSLEVVRNETNIGFAAACNQGAAGSEADYLLFLNPDTRLFDDTLAAVTRFMESDRAAEIGICGGQMLHSDGSPAISCARFPTLRTYVGKMTGLGRLAPGLFPRHHLSPAEAGTSRVVDQVIGAFFLIRRELFERLGGFDTRYFIYYEEVDLSLRAFQRGYRSYFLKEARALHIERVSSDQIRDVRLYHSLRSRLIYARLHWPRPQSTLLAVLTVGVELPLRLAVSLLQRRSSEISVTLSAYRMLLRDLPRGSGV